MLLSDCSWRCFSSKSIKKCCASLSDFKRTSKVNVYPDCIKDIFHSVHIYLSYLLSSPEYVLIKRTKQLSFSFFLSHFRQFQKKTDLTSCSPLHVWLNRKEVIDADHTPETGCCGHWILNMDVTRDIRKWVFCENVMNKLSRSDGLTQ